MWAGGYVTVIFHILSIRNTVLDRLEHAKKGPKNLANTFSDALAILKKKIPAFFVGDKSLLRCVAFFINPRVRKIRNEAFSCPRIFSRTLRFYYVASSPGSPPGLPKLLDGHRKLVRSSAIPARSCPGPVRYHWGNTVELEVPPDETPGLMTLHPHKTNVLQSITYAKSPHPPDRSNPGQKN